MTSPRKVQREADRAEARLPEPEQPLVPVFVTTGVRTSAGPGPGVLHVPQAEANALCARKHAVPGTEPPRGYAGTPEPAVRRFDDDHQARGSRRDDGLRR